MHGLLSEVHSDDRMTQTDVARRDLIPQSTPDGTRTATSGESEGVVWPPGELIALTAYALENLLERGHGNALADPLPAHAFERMGPHLEVVGEEECIRHSGAES